MSGKVKLTKAQRELLLALPTHCVEYYPPRKKLIEMGLAAVGPRSQLVITPAGRSALEQSS